MVLRRNQGEGGSGGCRTFTTACLRKILSWFLAPFWKEAFQFCLVFTWWHLHKHQEPTWWVELPFCFCCVHVVCEAFPRSPALGLTSSHRPYGNFGKTSPFPYVLISRSTALRYIILLSKSELGTLGNNAWREVKGEPANQAGFRDVRTEDQKLLSSLWCSSFYMSLQTQLK